MMALGPTHVDVTWIGKSHTSHLTLLLTLKLFFLIFIVAEVKNRFDIAIKV